jgi:uncharacterized RDD family membrane protein YckC
MNWYYSENGERRGPVSEVDLLELSKGGKLPLDTLVWRDGWTDWRPLSQSGLTSAATGNVACVECGKVFPTSEMIEYEGSWVCGTCKPIFFQKVKEGVVTPGRLAYAGFWIRFLAKVIDNIILQIIFIPLRFFAPANPEDPAMLMRYIFLTMGVSIGFTAAYQIFFVGKWGATIGKMALRLKVVRADGSKLTYGRACGRYFAELLSSLTLLIGYIMAAFDEEKRSLHDRICDTRVIRTNP